MRPSRLVLALLLAMIVAGQALAETSCEWRRQGRQAELVITGIAPSDSHCTQVVARMGAHSAFKNVRLVYQRHRLMGERILREFQIRCLLVEKQREDPGGKGCEST